MAKERNHILFLKLSQSVSELCFVDSLLLDSNRDVILSLLSHIIKHVVIVDSIDLHLIFELRLDKLIEKVIT